MICSGCGVLLQADDPLELGYFKGSGELCVRCFEMKHYNKIPTTFLTNSEYEEVITEIAAVRANVFMVGDIMNFENTFVWDYQKYIGANDLVVVVNKVDLLPKAVRVQKIKKFILKQTGISEVIITSCVKGFGISEIYDKMYDSRVLVNYFMGYANTGKSSLITQLIRGCKKGNEPTVSYYPGTTLGRIEFEIDHDICIIDTPGIIQEGSILDCISQKTFQLVIPKNEIRPITYQLNSGQTLFISGFCQFNFIEGARTSFTIYVANTIDIHRTKLESAVDFRRTHLGVDIIVPPTEEELLKIGEFEEFFFEVVEGGQDIVIANLGFITINKILGPVKISIIKPKSVKISQRDSLLGG
jgi:30S ribosome assembly GTPase